MSIEKKIRLCLWKRCLASEKKIYNKYLTRGLVINSGNSFLYKVCEECDGKNTKCKYYSFRGIDEKKIKSLDDKI